MVKTFLYIFTRYLLSELYTILIIPTDQMQQWVGAGVGGDREEILPASPLEGIHYQESSSSLSDRRSEGVGNREGSNREEQI